MTSRISHVLFALPLSVGLVFLTSFGLNARETAQYEPTSAQKFISVELKVAPKKPIPVIRETQPTYPPSERPRSSRNTPSVSPVAVVKPTSANTVPINGKAVRGKATYYCCTTGYAPGAMVAAAGSELRIGKWRGRVVTVSYQGRSIQVKLVDWCGCKGSRIIDLQPEAFAALAPLSRGVLTGIKVTW